MRIARWLPSELEREAPAQRPWLEAPSPFEYLPPVEPKSERQNLDDDEERVRVIIIDM